MRYRNKAHFDNYCTELARRLGVAKDVLMQMPIIEVAKLMAKTGETGGIRMVSNNA